VPLSTDKAAFIVAGNPMFIRVRRIVQSDWDSVGEAVRFPRDDDDVPYRRLTVATGSLDWCARKIDVTKCSAAYLRF